MTGKRKTGSSIRKTPGEKFLAVFSHAFLTIFSVLCIGAFLIVLGSSLQTQSEILERGYSILPRVFSLEAYKSLLTFPDRILNAYGITILTTVIGTFIGVCISAGAGYVISRNNYRYKNILSFYVFFTMLFNGGLVPSYILITQWLGLKNNMWALILPMIVNGWYIILMKGFFQGLPEAMLESAKIDGASEVFTFLRIVLPVSTPVLATISLFYVLSYWNDWYLSLLYIDNENLYKLQFLLMQVLKKAEFLNSEAGRQMQASGVSQLEIPTLNVRMAVCVLAAGPILIIFPFFQKYFVKGITIGSVKG